jgi:hypothetical protein
MHVPWQRTDGVGKAEYLTRQWNDDAVGRDLHPTRQWDDGVGKGKESLMVKQQQQVGITTSFPSSGSGKPTLSAGGNMSSGRQRGHLYC